MKYENLIGRKLMISWLIVNDGMKRQLQKESIDGSTTECKEQTETYFRSLFSSPAW